MISALDEFFAEWQCWEKHNETAPARVKISAAFVARLSSEIGESPHGFLCGIPLEVVRRHPLQKEQAMNVGRPMKKVTVGDFAALHRAAAARALLTLVLDHHKACSGSDCPILLSSLLSVYRDLMDRDLDEYEVKLFL